MEIEGPVVRRRHADDLGECVRVLERVHRRDGYPVNWPAEHASWVAGASALGAWVVEVDGRLVGHVGLGRAGEGDLAPGLWSERTGAGRERTAVLSRLFVAPEARGRGIGALLIDRAVREAGRHGLHPVLDVVASDVTAYALYERLGWQLLGTVQQRWQPGQLVSIRCYAAGPG